MRYFYLLSAFLISAVVATPMEQAKRDLELDTRACLPTGCGTAGVSIVQSIAYSTS